MFRPQNCLRPRYCTPETGQTKPCLANIDRIIRNVERLYHPKAGNSGPVRRPGDIAARWPQPDLRRGRESRSHHSLPFRPRPRAALARGDGFCFLSLGRDWSHRLLSRVQQVSGWPCNFQPCAARRMLRWLVCMVRRKLVLARAEKKSLTTKDTKVHKEKRKLRARLRTNINLRRTSFLCVPSCP
jgi:hypothetical protein